MLTERVPHLKLLVALTGYKQSGKDEACKILVKEFGFTQYAFADALRELALRINPTLDLTDVDPTTAAQLREQAEVAGIVRYHDAVRLLSYDGAKQLPDARRFLQRLGTEGIRKVFGADAWINAVEVRMRAEFRARVADKDPHFTGRVVISDLRFRNECAWFHELQVPYQVWRATRPGYGSDGHASELDIPHLPIAHIISNIGSLKFYRDNVRQLAQQLPAT